MADLTPAQMQDEREKVRGTLASRVTAKCPRCGTMEFTLLDGYVILPLSPKSNRAVLGGKTVSCAATACVKCGYVSLHSLTHLGIAVPAPMAH
jgi:ribosomal protein L37E